MPYMTDEPVRAGIVYEEDLSLLYKVSMNTAGVSHLELCYQNSFMSLIPIELAD